MKKIILASQSPRRKALLKNIGLNFEVIPSYIDETMGEGKSIADEIEKLALKKAMDVADRCKEEALVIGADTVVVLDEVLGKPSNKEEARQMLTRLSGATHQVITGIAIVDTSTGEKATAHQNTKVTMKDYDSSDIESYIASGEYKDKAGSYGIQGLGALLVKEIKGDYFNIVGLPLGLLHDVLRKFNVDIFFLLDHNNLQ